MTCPHCGATGIHGSQTCPVCGMPLLVPLLGKRYALTDGAGREFALPRGISRIGRDPSSNEIVLLDPSVSSRHAAIEVSPQAVVLRDIGSTNGTRLNGRQLTQAVILKEGDRVTFGSYELRVSRHADDRLRPIHGAPTLVTPASRPAPDPEPAPGAQFASALATMALILLAALLHAVGIADVIQRDDLPVALPLLILGLVVIPLVAIVLLAINQRWGYGVATVTGILGIAFVVVSGPIFAGGPLRNELTGEYGSTGFWFIAAASILALVTDILVLTVAVAGFRVTGQRNRLNPSY